MNKASPFENGFYIAFVITFIIFLYHNFYNFGEAPFWESFTETKGADKFASFTSGTKYSLGNVIVYSSTWLVVLTLFFTSILFLKTSVSNTVIKKNKNSINAYRFTQSTWSTDDDSLKYRFKSDKTLLRIKNNIPEEGVWQYFDTNMTTVVISVDKEKSILTRVSDNIFIDQASNKTLHSN